MWFTILYNMVRLAFFRRDSNDSHFRSRMMAVIESGWSGIDFEHRHERNSYLFGLFKQASQCNEVIPKIRPPDRGKNKQQKLVIRPDSC